MNLKQIIPLYTLLCGLTVTVSYARPTLPNSVSVFLPQLLNKSTIEERQLDQLQNGWGQSGASTQRYWVAFSDRSHNTTYETPNTAGQKCDELAFNEMVRIAEISNDMALVYTETVKEARFPQISTSAESKGWVPMKNLLLWATCPTNEFGIYNKALIMDNINEARNVQNTADIGSRYKNPATRDGKQTLSSDYQFYFVMKKGDNDLVLLAKESNLNGRNSQVLYGWVHPSQYAPWNQRTCLEPNWEPSFVNVAKGKKVSVFGDKACSVIATTIEMGSYEDKSMPGNPQRYRLQPQVLRYPLLDNDRTNNIYRMSAFARHSGESYQPTADELAGELGKQQAIKDMGIVNLIVVIDGTKGMANYFPFAKEAVRKAYDYFGRENRTVKVGVVIYRDKADGQYETEFCPMRSPDDARLEQFLQNGGNYGIKSASGDRDDFSSLYKGIDLALDAQRMGYNFRNSNLMFVIGQCGNDPNDRRGPTQEAIIKKMARNRVQISSFMVNRQNGEAWNLFRSQMCKIVTENMNQQYTRRTKLTGGKFKPQTDGFDFEVSNNKSNIFFIGSFRQPNAGSSLDPSRLYSMIQKTSQQFDVAMQAQIDGSGNIEASYDILANKSNYKPEEVAAAEVNVAFFEDMLEDKPSVLQALKKSKNITAFEGFVKKFSEGASINMGEGKGYYWRPVIYISRPEFDAMMAKLQIVFEAVERNIDARPAYVEAMKALVRSMLPGVTETEMNQKTNEEIMNEIAGLNERTETLENYKLIDIQNQNVVSDNDFRAITTQFIDKYKTLNAMRTQKYKFSIERNGIVWYWIPADDLP